MHIGSIVIANDLLGTILEIKDSTVIIVDKNNTKREIRQKACVEVTNPYAYAALVYKNLQNKMLKGK